MYLRNQEWLQADIKGLKYEENNNHSYYEHKEFANVLVDKLVNIRVVKKTNKK